MEPAWDRDNASIQYVFSRGLPTILQLCESHTYKEYHSILYHDEVPKSRPYYLEAALGFANYREGDEPNPIKPAFLQDPNTGPKEI